MGKKVLAESGAAAGDKVRKAKAGTDAAEEARQTAKPKRAKKAAELRLEAEPESEKAGRRAKAETELYAPVKRWLEARGYEVRGEVRGCDVVAVREGEPWPVVVELKKRFNLSLFLQAVERRATTPHVYVAAERSDRKNAFALSELRRLCELIGVGLLTVRLYKRKPALVELHCEPAAGAAAIAPRAPGRRTAKLLDEFRERSGDYNAGGATGRKLVTAYREKALRCAEALHVHGPLAPRQVRDLIASDMAQSILRRNVYGWFRRERRGIYAVTPAGVAALEQFADVLRGAAARAEP
ncbi:DUF2161 family putative PD-(D/E)XK-type phosphodiesterase [Paenibacillus sp.]|uniref:DUF2161 family putative PD-(D/E)XK-type phosphodiesterase n=1 Tax=Paenibacillus sp. TaxID=58172 RepID=UPI002D62FC80|nr:DUF2161 family putative PD-(D/E)XK-type phosphodiesterase [Paenibacillus sp.]HZG83669.1 DUF2161 family putative PD-(D/E)XK-type phosphodiesterase [Paenibacillus sp.]